jgi:hypothetical protein
VQGQGGYWQTVFNDDCRHLTKLVDDRTAEAKAQVDKLQTLQERVVADMQGDNGRAVEECRQQVTHRRAHTYRQTHIYLLVHNKFIFTHEYTHTYTDEAVTAGAARRAYCKDELCPSDTPKGSRSHRGGLCAGERASSSAGCPRRRPGIALNMTEKI